MIKIDTHTHTHTHTHTLNTHMQTHNEIKILPPIDPLLYFWLPGEILC